MLTVIIVMILDQEEVTRHMNRWLWLIFLELMCEVGGILLWVNSIQMLTL
jgi:hypothetical protein